jgi:glycosyltransferase involved in cell wall biosynthesis
MDIVRQSTGRAIHVGVDAHLLSLAETYRSAGIHWYIQNLLSYLPAADSAIKYTVFLGEKRYSGAPGLDLQISRLPTHQPIVRIVWEQVIQPAALGRSGVDLIHGMAFVGPLLSACPSVVTVHDLSFLFYPQGFRKLNRLYLRIFTRLSVHRAQRIIAVSESTKRALVQQYGLLPAKIDVVHNGVDPSFRLLQASQVAAFRAEQGLPERFILFVGTLEPRKNVAALIEAYARLSRSRPPLMLVGGKGWLHDGVFARMEALGLTDEVRFVGYVPAGDLPFWYNAADLFVYPSLYEGFGLPPLEAMACGTPVITSAASSLPEVVSQAGLLVDPTSIDDLVSAMARVLADADLREEMRAAGLVQASLFSWQQTAQRTAASYRRALAAKGGEGSV